MPNLINLRNILPSQARVIFSSLHSAEERSEIDNAVAAIGLPGGRVIDVQWNDDKKKYVIGLFSDEYRRHDANEDVEVDAPSEVIQLLWSWSNRYCTNEHVSMGNTATTVTYLYTATSLPAVTPSSRLVAAV
jgi:hypothetical protein